MCGIAGLIPRQAGSSYEHVACVESMLEVMQHRGPDGRQVHRYGSCILGHARLSIIDLQNGDQPLHNATNSVHLICNGEIYGYRPLLEAARHRREVLTNSDCEVLLHTYLERPHAGFSDGLNGMYAYCLFDEDRHRILLGVDDLGIKPLYYVETPNYLLFASELRSLLSGMAMLKIPISVDQEALQLFLHAGRFDATAGPIQGVMKFRPGQTIEIDVRSSKLSSIRHRAEFQHPKNNTVQHHVDNVRQALHSSVQDQLVADVPVGLLLSGGIDSSLVACIASQYTDNLMTFSIGFTGNQQATDWSEVNNAEFVARAVGSNHHTVVVDSQDVLDNLLRSMDAMDEPICDPAVTPLLLISEETRKRVKVCLTGDGGDELFGGYRYHQFHTMRRIFRHLPNTIIQNLTKTMSSAERSRWVHRLETIVRTLMLPRLPAGPWGVSDSKYQVQQQQMESTLMDVLATDLDDVLPYQMLHKTDRISMSVGLEARVPLLDQRVLAAASICPDELKVRRFRSKWILKEILTEHLPRDFVHRPKMGFRVPIRDWFRTEMRTVVHSSLSEQHCRIPAGVITPAEIFEIVDDHVSDRRDNSLKIWALMCLNNWMKNLPTSALVKSTVR